MVESDRPGDGRLLTEMVRRAVGDHRARVCADLMCCEGNITRFVGFKEVHGYDNFDWSQVWKEGREGRNQFHLQDVVLDFPELDGAAYVCLDGIEHLAKSDGHRLLERMEGQSDSLVLFTPLEFFSNPAYREIPGMEHLSLWLPEDLDGSWKKAVFPNWHAGSPDAIEKGFVCRGTWFFWKGGCSEKELEEIL